MIGAADTGSTITLTEENKILQRTLPQIPQGTFYQRNQKILIISSLILMAGIIGMLILVKI